MKKLPIGIQTFSKIIEGDYVYVDKTEIALGLIDNGSYYFLSRPRRFGKSLFLDTLKEIFSGNKELFKGLHIHDKWDFEETSPVLKISFAGGFYGSLDQLNRKIRFSLKSTEKDLGHEIATEDPAECFQELIWYAYEKYQSKVVILIDEYDKPILDNITEKQKARSIRGILKDFYSTIKHNDRYIRFVLITGVSKFSKMNLFSGLNNLNDITIDGRFGNICGYTHQDLLNNFQPHLEGADMEEVKKWYNGYNYFGDRVYNPYDILLFIDKGKEFRNYWWSTGNPSFLIDLLKLKDYSIPQLVNYIASEEMLNSFDVDNIELEALLWQTGYLTIAHKINEPYGVQYQLKIPNKEIQISLNSLFISHLTGDKTEKTKVQHQLAVLLKNADTEGLKTAMTNLFASIAHSNYTNNDLTTYEGYYASVVFAYFSSLGYVVIPEDTTNKGRIDLTIQLPNKIYIFEFKVVDKPNNLALQQVKDRQYHQKYTGQGNIYLIGIEFGRQERNILHWETEVIDK